MAVLTTQQRNALPASKFAVPSEQKFPIPDKAHARNALARLNQAKGLSEEEKKKVLAMAHAKLGKKKEDKKETAAHEHGESKSYESSED